MLFADVKTETTHKHLCSKPYYSCFIKKEISLLLLVNC